MERGEKVKRNKSKNWTEAEELLLMAWVEDKGFGLNVRGSLDFVRNHLAIGTDEALNILASGWFNAIANGIMPRTPEAIWGRWSKNTKRFKTTWERLWDESGRWEWEEKWEEKKDCEAMKNCESDCRGVSGDESLANQCGKQWK